MGLRTWLGLKKKRAPIERPVFFCENSYSQIQQDRWVLHELNNKTHGFFVEIGAFDGHHLSNSLLLERDFSWSGILVEPNPALSDSVRSTRTSPLDTHPVDSVSGRQVIMRFVLGEPELSSMAEIAFRDKHAENRRKESIEVEQTTISLNDLLFTYNAPSSIDYMSIDTEGNEIEILRTFDFERYNVKLLSVEHNHTQADAQIEELLAMEGYERVYRDWSRFDGWYRKLPV